MSNSMCIVVNQALQSVYYEAILHRLEVVHLKPKSITAETVMLVALNPDLSRRQIYYKPCVTITTKTPATIRLH